MLSMYFVEIIDFKYFIVINCQFYGEHVKSFTNLFSYIER